MNVLFQHSEYFTLLFVHLEEGDNTVLRNATLEQRRW